MRKFIISAISLVALAAIAVPFANAATTDVNGVVTVSKGEIMAQFPGMNEYAFQTIAMAAASRSPAPTCSPRRPPPAWAARTAPSRTTSATRIITSPIALTEIYNGSADKVTGWTLGAKGASVITETNTDGTLGPLPGLRHHLRRTRQRDEPLRDLRTEPQRRDHVHVQRHARQHRGQPVRGPRRLIQPRTNALDEEASGPPPCARADVLCRTAARRLAASRVGPVRPAPR